MQVGGGGIGLAKALEKNFWLRPSTFLALNVQLVILVSAFVMVSTVWSVSCLLRAQPFVKVGERAPMHHCVQIKSILYKTKN